MRPGMVYFRYYCGAQVAADAVEEAMAYGIGIDTGGTYTDAVVFDLDARQVLAKGKSPTTKHDLSLGIGGALDSLPRELLERAELVALSTTLATNACVEGKGGRARLVLMGTTRKTLEWIEADKKYGLNFDDVLCLNTGGTFDGRVVDQPDWAKVIAEHDDFFRDAEALGVAEVNALHNGAVCETGARNALVARYGVPFVRASELVSGLNVMERGATALLNARLLPVVKQFMEAVDKALRARGIDAPRMIVRSDGSLMVDELACTRPVETILSGPAASVLGGRELAECENCLIVDMGGTTTDISIVRDGVPGMTGGIRIGGWRTQIKGVFIDTLGLGGDTRVYMRDAHLELDTRRVEPLCVAAARWPVVKAELERLLESRRVHTLPIHEFLYLVREPDDMSYYAESERELIAQLKDGPAMIGGDRIDMYSLGSERLENEGIVMRCGLTPTDIMHIKGDFDAFDREASELGARYFLRALPQYKDDARSLAGLCDEVYGLVKRRLFENVARVLIEARYPEICRGGLDGQLRALIARRWERRDQADDAAFCALRLDVGAALIGIGAPTHIFLPEVAQALGTRCVISEHSGVANAIGAVVADINARASVEIRADYAFGGLEGYSIHAPGVHESFDEYEQALDAARTVAEQAAVAEARRRGALGELSVDVQVRTHVSHTRDGGEVDLGTAVVALATGRMSA